MLPYTKPENQWDYGRCEGYNGISAILATDAALLDADDPANCELLLKVIQGEKLQCRMTDRVGGRGLHANFLDRQGQIAKSGTKVMLACGIVVDMKIGRTNGLETIRWQGIERTVIYDEPPYQDIPRWLLPVDTVIDFQSMAEGDGRNQALFNYILTLQRNGLTIEEIRETISITNKYVLKEPIGEKELETILRDDAFKKQSFIIKGKFQHEQFADYMMRNHHISLIDNQLCTYQNGIYTPTVDALERAIIKELPVLRDSQIKEVTKRLWRVCQPKQQAPATLIAFSNGIYDLTDDEFREFNPSSVILNRVPWAYNPDANSELLNHTLDRLACGDAQIRALLEEAVGYCLYRRNELGKAFILIGDKSNGKSTFLDMVKTMLGYGNTSSLDLNELNDRFKTAELFGKLANIGDDIGDEFIANASTFRKLVTGEYITAERKGQDPFEFSNYSKLMFSANSIPRIKDKTGAVQRRLVIVPFDARFTVDDPDFRPFIKYELREQPVMEHLIVLGLAGLKRLLDTRKFTEPPKVKTATEEYRQYNNPILGFIDEVGTDAIENEPTKNVYRSYKEHCMANNFQPLSNVEFSRQICKELKMTTIKKKIKGVQYRIFEKGTD